VGIFLTYSHIYRMVMCMKTTLNIDESVMALKKKDLARRECTMSELVKPALSAHSRLQTHLPDFASRRQTTK